MVKFTNNTSTRMVCSSAVALKSVFIASPPGKDASPSHGAENTEFTRWNQWPSLIPSDMLTSRFRAHICLGCWVSTALVHGKLPCSELRVDS